MKYCICKNQSQESAFRPCGDLHFENFFRPMVGLIVDSVYERISDTLSVNYAENINKMAMIFARIKFTIVFSSRLITYILKIFSRA